MKSLLFFFFSISLCYAEIDPKQLAPENIRRILSPYMKILTKDEVHLKKEKDKIDLGRHLFYDKRFSPNSDISCNSCHDLKNYGTNGELYKKIRKEGKLFRDVPSIYNLKNFELFNWDGQYKTLEKQTTAAISSKHEMNMPDIKLLMKRLKKVPAYIDSFKKAFPNDTNPLNFKNAVQALVEFQKGLITLAPIDRFLKGDDKALTEDQLKGAYVFDQRNCLACHTGASFGGQMVIKLGITEAWPNQKDQGYYDLTKNPKHKMTFRVSPLRNIEKTAPYFHDASSKRMWEAVRKMGRHEIGQNMSVEEILLIQNFFKSLTGEISEEYIKKPKTP